MPDTLLLNPPSPADMLANREGTTSFGTLSDAFLYPPHTLAVLAATCQQANLHVQVLDAVGEKLDLATTIERIGAADPSVLAVYCSWGTLDADREQLAGLRAAFPRMPIVAIGAGVRYSCDELLIGGASHILLGDPELALPELLSRPLPVPGIVKARTLLPDQHNHGGLLRDPATLPRPNWDAVPWQLYGFLTLFGGRGCDDRCKFCAYVVAQGRAYRPRTTQDVVQEMLWLADSYNPTRIMVRDIVFAQDRTRTMAILQGLIEARFHTPWECESRPEHFDKTLLKKMAQAGCTVLKLGIESADPDMLAALGRVSSPTEAAHYLAYCRSVVAEADRCGIRTRAFVMVGLPGQTMDDVERTAAYLRELKPTFIHPRPYIAYPRLPLGPGQSAAEIERLLAPLLAVAEERQAIANRPPGLIRHLRQRLRL
ncbi:MAG: radical SAM protein [Chloroflexi bacterium]|nr:radical SAM protein [Chloroflexota bacterium]